MPIFGNKVLANYRGRVDIHGCPRKVWTHLSGTANVNATEVHLMETVDWKVGESVVIATTDFNYNHTETAVIQAVSNDG